MAATTHDKKDAKEDDAQTVKDFHQSVNMTPAALEKWLQTDESKKVGYKGADGNDESKESVGHKSGEKIIEILHKKKADYESADIAHMKKVVSYIHRHLAQKPKSDDLKHTNWTYSLKNWGHDPGKDK